LIGDIIMLVLKHRMDFDSLTHDQLEALSEDCEDYLIHRYIPLTSHSYSNIINQAIKEGYRLEKFDRFIHKSSSQ
jgi:hypothetical protein